VRILDAVTLATLVTEAVARGLTPLVEVVTDEERLRARQAGARLIGVNARDLDTLEMDREGATRVLAALDDTVVAVHLSGLATPADVAAVAEGRADAALIGEALMRQDDPSELLGRMVEAARAASTR
jgi:indole-3-glycerol phosphate synthase